MKLSDLKIDPKRRQEGDWIPLDGLDGKIKVRGARNYDWLRVQEAEAQRIRREANHLGPLNPEQNREILIECILQAGLIGWSGDLWKDDNGDAIPYSIEAASQIYRDPAYEVLVDITAGACETMAFVAEKSTEETAKN